jgi:hypothetical protein
MWNLLKKLDNELVVYFNTKDSSRKTLHKAKDIQNLCIFDYSEYIIFCVIRYETLHKELKDMLTGIKGINMSEKEVDEILAVRINESKKLINSVDRETEELILKKIPEVEKDMGIFNYKIDKLVIVQGILF